MYRQAEIWQDLKSIWGDQKESWIKMRLEPALNKFMSENYTLKDKGYYLISCRSAQLFLSHPNAMKAGLTITSSHIFYFKGDKYVLASPGYGSFIPHKEIWSTQTGLDILIFMKKYGIIVDPPNQRDHMEISRVFNRRLGIYGADLLKKGLYKNAYYGQVYGNTYVDALKKMSRVKDVRSGLYLVPLSTSKYSLREAKLEYGDRNIFYYNLQKYVILVEHSRYEPHFLADHQDIYDSGRHNPLLDFMLDHKIKVKPKGRDWREIEHMIIHTRRGHLRGVELIHFF